MMNAVVAHAYRADLALGNTLDQSLPGAQPAFLAAVRCMQ